MENKGIETPALLIQLSKKVLEYYNIKADNVNVIQSGTIKTVWKITAGKRILCLKRLKQTIDKALFSVNAQVYIKRNNGNVPGIIPSQEGKLIVEHDSQLFVLYEWLEGKNTDFMNKGDLEAALDGLARFHTASKGYLPVESARISSKQGKWPEQYNSMKTRLISWKAEAAKARSSPSHAAYLKCVDAMVSLADLSLERLNSSQYNRISGQDGSMVLCHQDYGPGNALRTPGGVYVIDLDGVTFDLPARDLRKIIGKQAEMRGSWDKSVIMHVLSLYCQVNPLDTINKKLLYIDMLFPHWFFGSVKNQYQNGKPLKAYEIEKTARLEQSKVPLLEELLKER